ncbi:MAG: GNAT family N-acetyltransferase [Thermoguttaceae bacterium]
MPIQYIKRFQMVYNLVKKPLESAVLPVEYVWIPWSPEHLETHASVKYHGFRDNMDSRIFPSFSSLESCRRLMDVISTRKGFLPGTTWLIAKVPSQTNIEADIILKSEAKLEYCATIQGLQHSPELGGIQNVAVLPEHRGIGLGQALLLKCLAGFKKSGVRRVSLEVTADNLVAVKLYQKVGFEMVQTVYKASMAERLDF